MVTRVPRWVWIVLGLAITALAGLVEYQGVEGDLYWGRERSAGESRRTPSEALGEFFVAVVLNFLVFHPFSSIVIAGLFFVLAYRIDSRKGRRRAGGRGDRK